MVDVDADQPVADGAMDERGGYGGIHSTGERAKDPPVRACGAAVLVDAAPDLLDVRGDEVGRSPVLAGTCDVDDEVAQDLAAALGVDDFGVELDAVQAALRVGQGGIGR